jgi:hypothetical protein
LAFGGRAFLERRPACLDGAARCRADTLARQVMLRAGEAISSAPLEIVDAGQVPAV